ncbi:MAG TPA: hypothetical protein VMQ56_02605 [Terracidiphilus sp.]|jgi:hypothetical protein|nr:hypothetical protein [Terracidiphilus sp.]
MKKFDDEANGLKERAVDQEDLELELALKDFRSSVHAWSDAVYFRPRAFTKEVRLRSWRLALGWALGCVLVAGSVSGGLLQRHHRVEQARIAAGQRAAKQQKQLREQQARAQVSDEALLAEVDSDVARQVPSALEPLAQMMDETK